MVLPVFSIWEHIALRLHYEFHVQEILLGL